MHQKAVLLVGVLCLFMAITKAQQTITFDTREEYQKGMACISAFQYDQAAHHFYECQRNEPQNLEYISKLAWCYLQTGNFSEAKLYFQKVLKADSVHVVALSNMGYLYEQERNHRQARQYYRQLIQIDTTNSYYYRLNAFNALKTSQPFEATVFFNRAHTLNPNDLVTINKLAELYLELDALEYAQTTINKGLQLAPDNLQLLYTSARIHNANKAHTEVVEQLEKALALHDSIPYYQTMLGVAYLRLDSLDKAVFQLENIVRKDKATEHTHHYLSIAYAEKDNTSQSIHHLEKAIEKAISPKASTYYEELAAHHQKQQSYKKALELYKEAFTHSGKPKYLFFIAQNTDHYYKDKTMALRQYQRYLATGHQEYREYATTRIAQIKEIQHLKNTVKK